MSDSAISHGRVTSLRRALLRRGSVVCALWRRVSATSAVGHGDDVRAVVERLVEVADAACDIGVTGEGEGDDGLRDPCGQIGYRVTRVT